VGSPEAQKPKSSGAASRRPFSFIFHQKENILWLSSTAIARMTTHVCRSRRSFRYQYLANRHRPDDLCLRPGTKSTWLGTLQIHDSDLPANGRTAMNPSTTASARATVWNILPQLPAASIDSILTDPPYLARYRFARTPAPSRTTITTAGSSPPSQKCTACC